MTPRKVLSFRLHTSINILGYGSAGGAHAIVAGQAVTGPNGGKPTIELYMHDHGVVIKARTFECLVPFANCQQISFAPEETPEKAPVKK